MSRLYLFEGQDQARVFELENGKIYTIGRSPNNDIHIDDDNISGYHLKVERKLGKFYLTDLNSRNGTFVDGRDIDPEVEVEVNEGVPIVIGMTVLGLGDTCLTCLKPILDSIGVYSEHSKQGDGSKSGRVVAFKRNLEFVYNVSDLLAHTNDVRKIVEKILGSIFDLLKRIDRCAVILTDGVTGKISDVTFRSRNVIHDPEEAYDRYLVEQSLMLNKAIFIPDTFDVSDEDDDMVAHLQQVQIRSVMCVPLCSYLKTSGVIYMDSFKEPYGFRMNDFDLIKDISSRVALALDNISINNSIGS